jgi:site-specific DNA-methyltransferase (adenine-specific)
VSDFTKSHISRSDDWATPKDVYDALDQEFHFNDDPCPLLGVSEGTGLLREWGTSVFMNPPYSKPTPWVQKAYLESQRGKTVVGLLRGETSTRWFHDWVYGKAELRFIKGRLRFNDSGPAPFPSIIAIWKSEQSRDDTAGVMQMNNERKAWIVSGIMAICWAIAASLAGTAVAFGKGWDAESYFGAWLVASFSAFFGIAALLAFLHYWLFEEPA